MRFAGQPRSQVPLDALSLRGSLSHFCELTPTDFSLHFPNLPSPPSSYCIRLLTVAWLRNQQSASTQPTLQQQNSKAEHNRQDQNVSLHTVLSHLNVIFLTFLGLLSMDLKIGA